MGRIMFVSSQAGQIGLFGYTAYSPSKFALRGLAESLQMEVCFPFCAQIPICKDFLCIPLQNAQQLKSSAGSM